MTRISTIAGDTARCRGRAVSSIRPGGGRQHGQSLVEFALIIPILFLIAVAVGDFGRVYVSAVTIESAAREAADYGAFLKPNWCVIADALAPSCSIPGNVPFTVAEMERRACTTASTLPDYEEPPLTVNHATCTNPTFDYALENAPADGPYDPSCSLEQAGCVKIVHVWLEHDFSTTIDFPPLPSTVHIRRDSYYAISELPV